MNTDQIITSILALGGWAFGFYQMYKNRKWQEKDLLINRKYDAYSSFMKKLDEINNSIRNNPNMIYGISNDLMQSILNGDVDEMEDALLKFNQKLIDFVKTSTDPLRIINQEISSLLLISSESLKIKLIKLKELNTDFYDEMQICLSKISAKDTNSLKVFETMGHDQRWKEFCNLHEEIMSLMRQEINVR